MYTVIRNYTGTPGLAEDLKKRNKDIESEISSVPGFVAYYLVKTRDSAAAITVCERKIGCDDSTKRAENWLKKNMPNLKINAPQIIAGELAFKFATYKTSV